MKLIIEQLLNGLTIGSFYALIAVSQLDLVVKKGKISSIIGPNGAGKTTVFNVITGIYKPLSILRQSKHKKIQSLTRLIAVQ